MRKPRSALLPIFRSQLQGELLALVLLSDEERSITETAAVLARSVATVQREISQLEDAGILASRKIGQTRLIRADRSSPLYEPLAELVLRAFGPVMVIEKEFAGLVDVERVEIFGSWAARYQGEQGPPPGDIDVVVVGPVDRDEVFSASLRAEGRLAREVNAMVISTDRWNARTDPIVREILARPRIPIIPPTDAEATTHELGTGAPRHPEAPQPGPPDAGDR